MRNTWINAGNTLVNLSRIDQVIKYDRYPVVPGDGGFEPEISFWSGEDKVRTLKYESSEERDEAYEQVRDLVSALKI